MSSHFLVLFVEGIPLLFGNAYPFPFEKLAGCPQELGDGVIVTGERLDLVVPGCRQVVLHIEYVPGRGESDLVPLDEGAEPLFGKRTAPVGSPSDL